MGICASNDKPLRIVNRRLQQRLKDKEQCILQLKKECSEFARMLQTSEEYTVQATRMEERISRLFIASHQLEADICSAKLWHHGHLHQDDVPALIRFIQSWVNTPINEPAPDFSVSIDV